MKKIFFFAALLLAAITGFSQPQMNPNSGLIVGKVVDADKKPLQYINVLVYKSVDSALIDAVATDTDGKFMFSNVPYDTYYLEFKFLGFANKRINNIEVAASPQNKRFVRIGEVSLDPETQDLGNVVVNGQTSTVQYQIDKKVINVGQDIQAAGGDASDALRNVPSVEVDVNGDVSLRGSSNFTVMVNGKPSILDPNDALKQIPASNIDKIEIITNPSAKYDPDGDAGIINIITKNKSDDGFSGKIELGGDIFLGYSADILLNYKKNKINFFTELDVYDKPHYMNMNQYRATHYDSLDFIIENEGEHAHGRAGKSAKVGLNYFLNDYNTFTFNFSAGQRQYKHGNTSFQHAYWSDFSSDYYFNNASDFLVNGIMYDGDINLDHKFNDNGHKIKAFAQYSYWEPTRTNLSSTDTVDVNGISLSDFMFQEQTVENISRNRFRFQLDYELPIGDKNKFEAGYTYRYLNAGGDYNIENFDYNINNWVKNDSAYNNMVMFRQIHAGYLTFSGSLKFFDYKLGIRGEYTDRLVTEEVTNSSFPIKRFDYFPTVHLSKELPFDQQVQLSYSKRINRPQGYNLNPFPVAMDRYTIRQGNPALAPEYTNSFELNYMKRFGKSYVSIESYYKQTNGKIDRIMQTDGQFIIFTAQNLNKDFSYGTEIMANLVIFKMLMLNASTNLYQYKLEGTLDGVDVKKETFSWNSRATLMTMLPTGTSIQIGGFYNAPTVTLEGNRDAMFVTFAGIRQSFFKKRLSVLVNVQDMFSTMKFAFTTETELLSSNIEFYSKYPNVGFTLTYRINNYQADKKNGREDQDVEYGGEGMY